MNKMREEFEVWCCKRGYTLKPAETNCGIIIDGYYGHPRVQLAWESWQESRAALCVELPADIGGEYYADGWNSALASVEEALKDCGVSCK